MITVPILTVVMQLPPFLWRQKGTHQSAAIPKCLQQTLSTHHREREVLLALFVFNKPNRQTNYFPVILFTCEHGGKQKCTCLDKLQNTFRTTYSLAVSLITPPTHTHTHTQTQQSCTHTHMIPYAHTHTHTHTRTHTHTCTHTHTHTHS